MLPAVTIGGEFVDNRSTLLLIQSHIDPLLSVCVGGRFVHSHPPNLYRLFVGERAEPLFLLVVQTEPFTVTTVDEVTIIDV